MIISGAHLTTQPYIYMHPFFPSSLPSEDYFIYIMVSTSRRHNEAWSQTWQGRAPGLQGCCSANPHSYPPFLFTLCISVPFSSVTTACAQPPNTAAQEVSWAHFPVCMTKSLRVPLESSLQILSSQLRVERVTVYRGQPVGWGSEEGLWLRITLRWGPNLPGSNTWWSEVEM